MIFFIYPNPEVRFVALQADLHDKILSVVAMQRKDSNLFRLKLESTQAVIRFNFLSSVEHPE